MKLERTKIGKAHYGWAVPVILVAIGAYAWGLELSEGHSVTGLQVPAAGGSAWGLGVINYMFFIGVSAGGFIIAASTHLFDVKRYRPLSRIATVLAIITIMLPPIFIFADIGRPDRFIHMMYPTPNFQSPMFFVLVTLSLYFALLVVETWFSMRPSLVRRRSFLTLGFTDLSERALKRDKTTMVILSAIGLPLAVSVHSVTGWLFGLTKSRPFWFSTIMAPIFLSSALVSGIGLLIFVCIVLNQLSWIKIQREIISDLGKLLAILIPIDLFLLFTEILTVGYGHETDQVPALMFLLTGSSSPLFWTEVIICGIIPFFMLLSRRLRGSTPTLTLIAILVVIGIWLKRWNLLVAGTHYSFQWFGMVGYSVAAYTPTWVEWSIMAGICALGTLLFSICVKFLPVAEEEAYP